MKKKSKKQKKHTANTFQLSRERYFRDNPNQRKTKPFDSGFVHPPNCDAELFSDIYEKSMVEAFALLAVVGVKEKSRKRRAATAEESPEEDEPVSEMVDGMHSQGGEGNV